LAILVGILLLFSAMLTLHRWFVVALGLLAIVKGLLLILDPKNMAERIVSWYANAASDRWIRVNGILLLILGTVILSWIL